MRTLQRLGVDARDVASQRCVCFTETPLEHLNLLLAPITDLQRQCEYRPYGIAITKRLARDAGVNPVWYTDITPGHDWLMKSVNVLIEDAMQQVLDARHEGDATACYGNYAIAQLTPFIEQMGSGEGYRKEFWWEREWRHVGHFALPLHFIVIAPENEHDDLSQLVPGIAAFIDSDWGIEEIIGRLAGFTEVQVGPNV